MIVATGAGLFNFWLCVFFLFRSRIHDVLNFNAVNTKGRFAAEHTVFCQKIFGLLHDLQLDVGRQEDEGESASASSG